MLSLIILNLKMIYLPLKGTTSLEHPRWIPSHAWAVNQVSVKSKLVSNYNKTVNATGSQETGEEET